MHTGFFFFSFIIHLQWGGKNEHTCDMIKYINMRMNDEEKEEEASVHSKNGFVILYVRVVAFPLLQVFWKVCGGILT
jgi:hypothetical protein